MPVEEARARVLADLPLLAAETIPLAESYGRTLAQDVVAAMNQPPAPVSAMDGYALLARDAATMPVTLRKIGTSRAGERFAGLLTPGTCVRIFTGAVVPDGAEFIALQEDASEAGDAVTIREVPNKGQFIRKAGLDFSVGSVLAASGSVLTARQIGVIAAAGHASVAVRRKPRIAVLSTGDELVPPGRPLGNDQIFASNGFALAATIIGWGGVPVDLGIAGDSADVIGDAVERAQGTDLGADMLITTGGASVGDHDLVQDGLKRKGFVSNFWRIAMRPGKPLMFGRLGDLPVMGMPGNPVSTLVCALLFLRPAMAKMLGHPDTDLKFERVTLAAPLPANDKREDYLRAELHVDSAGHLTVSAARAQDSSMLMTLTKADALVRRPPFAEPAQAGEEVDVLRLDPLNTL